MKFTRRLIEVHTRQPRAFTLVETMLALGLSAILLAGIYAAIDQSWKLVSSGREEMERAQLARALFQRMSLDIRAVTFEPPPPADDSTTATTSTSTTSTSSTSGGSSGSGSGGSGTGSGGGTGNRSGGGGGSGGGNRSGGSSTGSGASGGTSSSASSSSSSSSSSTSSTSGEPVEPNSKAIGLRGTNLLMELSISRPRRDLLPGTAVTAGMPGTSDLRTVTYSFVPAGSGAMSGLIRTEGDRMAIEQVELKGGSPTQMSAGQVLAPEVIAINFQYFDGVTWQPTWDSETNGRIPRAVEIQVKFTPPKTQKPLFNVATSRSMESFRTVVLIPVSDPFPQEVLE